MAFSMVAMMALSAVPFFAAYQRDRRRPAATAGVILTYLSIWALLGFLVDYVMGMVMMPSSALVAAVAAAVAVAYVVTPWGRWARDRCREMAQPRRRGDRLQDALAEGASYAACCVVCTAGIMLALLAIGVSNPLVIGVGAVVMLGYKITPWRVPDPSRIR